MLNGTWYSSRFLNAVFYRGDGANTSIVLPAGTTVDSIEPFQPYTAIFKTDWNETIVTFENAVENGERVTILLKDNSHAATA